MICNSEDEFRSWFGLCESRMRLLIVGLESDGVHAYPYAKFFHRREKNVTESRIDDEHAKYVTSHFVALRFTHTAKKVDLGPLVLDFLQVVNSFEGRTPGMDLAMRIVSKLDLPPYVFSDNN
jgi:poly(A) polymerase Pap1